MQNVRLRFSKTFDARYISHLDLMRCFSRAIKQSGVDAWYTEGFNPHLYITFALPLSLGQESICEVADIKLNGTMDQYLAERINRCLPFGVEIYDTGPPRQKVSEIAWARYHLELGGGIAPQAIAQAANELWGRGSIVVHKTTKKGAAETDIKPLIARLTATVRGEQCLLDMTLAAGQQVSLNPQAVLEQIFPALGAAPDHQLIKRVSILNHKLNTFE